MVEEMAGSILAGLGALAGEAGAAARDIGAEIINGMTSEIIAKAGEIAAAAVAAVQGALDAARSVLGIRSPSRAFAEIGHQTMAGFAQGVQEGVGTATRAVTTALQAATTAANWSSFFAPFRSAIEQAIQQVGRLGEAIDNLRNDPADKMLGALNQQQSYLEGLLQTLKSTADAAGNVRPDLQGQVNFLTNAIAAMKSSAVDATSQIVQALWQWTNEGTQLGNLNPGMATILGGAGGLASLRPSSAPPARGNVTMNISVHDNVLLGRSDEVGREIANAIAPVLRNRVQYMV